MTLDEAIKHAEEVVEENSKSYEEWLACKNRGNVGWSKSDIEAVDKSIEQCKKCAEEHRQLAEWLKDYKRLKEQEPCDDAISRQTVLDMLENINAETEGVGFYYNHYVEYTKKLPPVTPQQKWILCKDHMPDYHQLVLTFDGEYICVEQRIPYIIDENGNKHIVSEWWVDVNYVTDSELYSGLRDGAAVAWMPLPTPPNKSEIQTGAESE